MLTEPINLTPDTLQAKLDQYREGRHARLLLAATALQLHAEPDTISGGWAVRSPRQRGYVELVIDGGCTCHEYQSLGSCPHTAHVATLVKAGAA